MPVQTFQRLIALFETEVSPMPDVPTEEDLRPWRDRIDALDRAILQMLNERAICANAIGDLKKRLGLPVYVPEREAEVLQNIAASNEGPLPDAAARRLFERVIDETRSLERQMYQEEPKSPTST